jgi:hypothetical protein
MHASLSLRVSLRQQGVGFFILSVSQGFTLG